MKFVKFLHKIAINSFCWLNFIINWPFFRLVEEVKEVFNTELENEDVFLAPTFSEFCMHVVLKSRGGSSQIEIEYRPVEMEVNKMRIRFPCQLFINGEFVDAENGKTTTTVNPATEEVICQVGYLF